MSERYFVTGVQLGLLQSMIEQNENAQVLKIINEIYEKQFIGNVDKGDNIVIKKPVETSEDIVKLEPSRQGSGNASGDDFETKKGKKKVQGKMKFEIINPSDEAYIEGSKEGCCVATVLFSEGQYGLSEVDGDFSMPLFLFGMGLDKWFKKEFGGTFKESLKNVSKEELIKCLRSVHLVRERTSLSDVVGYAHNLADSISKSGDDKHGKK